MNLVMDAGAIIAYLEDEPGAEVVEHYLGSNLDICFIHALNLCEVYYGVRRAYGESAAQETLVRLGQAGLVTREDLDEELWMEAGRIKADYKRVSIADCICVALANRLEADIITCDRHEMGPLSESGVCSTRFIR